MMKRTKKVLAELLLICMMISSVIPAYAETAEILTGTEVVEEAPEQEETLESGSPEELEVKEDTPEAVPEVEKMPAEPVEEAGDDGDLVCTEVIEAAEAVEAEETDEGTGDAAESIGTEKTAKEKLLGTSQHNEHDEITDWKEWTNNSELPVATGSYYLKQDVTLDSTWSVPSDGITNLCLNGYVIKANTSEEKKFSVITVPVGATLNLYDCDTTTEHYFTVGADGLWTLTDSETKSTKTVTGGVITGGKNDSGNGGGVSNSGTFTMSGGIITGNTAIKGGGVYAAYSEDFKTDVILVGGTITGNRAEEDGGGVYVQEEMCFAAGTLITMEDGSRKPIETLEIGDPVRVFDHDTGAISTAKLFDLWKYPEKHSGAVTLHFSHGIDVTVVYGHSFFDREANKYVSVSRDNVDSYVGHEFYNVDDECWETLDDYDLLDGEVDTYVITSEKHLNCVANGMLSNEDGLYTTLTNVFEYDDSLKIDAEKKADDLEKYGLFGYEEQQYVSKETYDILNLQYLNVAFGKGMITKDAVLSLGTYWSEVDPELLCGTTAQPCFDEAGETYFETSSGSVQNDKPKMLSAAEMTEPKDIAPGVYLGGTIKIIDNTAKTAEGTTVNNLYLPGGKTITLGTCTGKGGNGIAAPEEDMNVGVTMENVTGPFTTNGTAEEVKYFTSDDKTLAVTHVAKESHLELVKSWTALQYALDGTTTTTVPGLFEINDGTIKLLRNFTAEEGDERFVVPAETAIALDLNGFTVDRGLTDEESAVEKGNVVTVNGKLTIEDNSDGHTGKITGGTSAYGAAVISNGDTVLESGSIAGCKAISEKYDKEKSVNGRGGAIYVSGNGTFTMNGGEISNCSASVAGGAIFNVGTVNITDGSISGCSVSGMDDGGTVKAKGGAVYNYGYSSFTMEGGEISGNTLRNVEDMRGAGVYAAAGADITLGGAAVITGNTDGGSENSNVFLYDGVTITLGTGEGGNGVAAPVTTGDKIMSIGVTMQTAGQFTAESSGAKAAEDCFTSDSTDYVVRYNNKGTTEVMTDDYLELVRSYVITNNTTEKDKDTNGGFIAIDQTSALKDDTITVTVTPNVGYKLSSLKYNDGSDHDIISALGVYSFVMPAAKVSVTATFAEKSGQTITADSSQSFTYGDTGKSITASTSGDGALSYAVKESAAADVVEVNGTTGALTIKKAGETTITITAAETDNYKGATKDVTVKVSKKAINKPTENTGKFTYSGSEQTYNPVGFDANTMNISGNKQTDANENGYTVKVTPKDNYVWSTEGDCQFTWVIDKAAITNISVAQTGTLTYTGQAQTATVSASATTVNSQTASFTYCTTESGTYMANVPAFTAAGEHTVYYKVSAPNHGEKGGSFTVKIARAPVQAPTIESKVYTGKKLTADVDCTDMPYTVTTNEGGTAVGDYNVVLTLSDTTNYKWSDSDEAGKTLTFMITRADNAWTTEPQVADVTYGTAISPVGEAKFGTVVVTYEGTGDTECASPTTAPTKAGTYKATFKVTGTTDYTELTKDVTFTIGKKQLTVTGTEVEPARVYDGTTTAKVTAAGTLDNAVTGDKVTLSAAAAFDDANAGENKKVTVTYTITGDDAGNYTAPVNKTDLKASITAKPLTVSGTEVSDKTYDGNTSATVSKNGTLAGVVDGDAVEFGEVTAAYDDNNVGTGKAVTVIYTIKGDAAANYIKPENNTSLTAAITKKAVTVTITPNGGVYGGTITGATAVLSGLVEGESVTPVLTYTGTGYSSTEVPTKAGTYTVTASLPTTDATAANYELTGTRTASFVISQAENSWKKEPSIADVTYGTAISPVGEAAFGTVVITYVGVEGTSYESSTNAPTKAGKYKATFAVTGTADYSSLTKDVTFTIGKKQLTVSGTTVEASRAYDGTKTATVTNVGTLGDKVGEDKVTLSAAASYADVNVGTGKTVTVTYTITGDDAGNYTAPVNKTDLKAAITALQLTASGTEVEPARVYDGTKAAKVTVIGTLGGKVDKDQVTLGASASFADKNVGTGKAVTVTYTITGEDAGNYIAPVADNSFTAAITAKQLTVSGTEVESTRVYDGKTAAGVTAPGSLTNAVSEDKVTMTAAAAYSDKNVGENKQVTVTYTITGEDAGNYIAPVTDSSFTAVITALQLTVTGTAVEEARVYDGTKVAKVTAEGSLTNAVEGDDITLGATAAFADANAGENKKVTVTYTITGDDAGNYTAPVNNTSLTASITKANVPAPLLKDSVTIDYKAETIAPKARHELSTQSGEAFEKGKITAETVIDFTRSYYIRKEEDANHFASAELAYTPVHPAAPFGFTAKEESIENKKDGTFSGITSAMEYQKDGGEWLSGPGTLSGLSDETITVRLRATEGEFASLVYVYTFTASTKKLTVTMGSAVDHVPYNGLVTRPADPEKEGYTFGGWYRDEGCTDAWNFALDTVIDDMTLYPKWIKNEEKKASIGGNVTEDGLAVPGAVVELFLGKDKVAAAVTDENGNYKFDNVKLGTYNIVVTRENGKTKTELVTVNKTGEFSVDVKLPKGDVNSVVEHKEGDVVPDAKSDISQTVVGGLDEIAEEEAPAGSDRITIKLTVEPKADEGTDAQEDIRKNAGAGKKVEFLDLSLVRQVNDGKEEDIGDRNTKLLTIVIPFDFEGVNVSGMMILRNHGGNTSKLTGTRNEDGEYFTVNRSAGTITIYAKKFSDYAIAYSEATTPDPSGGGSGERNITAYAEPVVNATAVSGTWVYKEAEDTWYYTADGSYLKNGWYYLANPYSKTVKTGWFCFDEAGRMQRGWILSKLGHWFFTHDIKDGDLGRLETGWHKDEQDGLSYYLDLQTGRMYTGWHTFSGVWYYFTETSEKTTWRQDEKGRWVATAAVGKPLGSLDPAATK